MTAPIVLVFGDINVDNIFTLSEIPAPGRDGYAEHAEMHLGGVACNSAAVLQLLGQPTRLFGAVGDDLWSHFVAAELGKVQLDTCNLVTKPGKLTGLIFIAVTPNGERTMFSYRGVNLDIQPEDIPQDILDGVGLLQLTGYDFMVSPQKECAWKLVELASERRIQICMDTGLDPVLLTPKAIDEVIPYLSVLITGAAEARQLTQTDNPNDQLERFLSLGVKRVAIKLGDEGAWLGAAEGFYKGMAFQVQVVDTTSAGDAFSAGVIFGYLRGMSPRASLLLANALGGLATTVVGAARFNREAVMAFLKANRMVAETGYGKETFLEVVQRLENPA